MGEEDEGDSASAEDAKTIDIKEDGLNETDASAGDVESKEGVEGPPGDADDAVSAQLDGENSDDEVDSFDKHIDHKEHHVPYNPKSTAHSRHHAILNKENERLRQEAQAMFDKDEDLTTGRPKIPEPHLPVSNFFWILFVTFTLYFENCLTIVAVTLISWSGLSQCAFMESYMFTDYRPDSLIITDPIEFQKLTIDHICLNVGCNPKDLNSSLFNVKMSLLLVLVPC